MVSGLIHGDQQFIKKGRNKSQSHPEQRREPHHAHTRIFVKFKIKFFPQMLGRQAPILPQFQVESSSWSLHWRQQLENLLRQTMPC